MPPALAWIAPDGAVPVSVSAVLLTGTKRVTVTTPGSPEPVEPPLTLLVMLVSVGAGAGR